MVLRILSFLFPQVRALGRQCIRLEDDAKRLEDDNAFLMRRNQFLMQETTDMRRMWEKAQNQLRLFSSRYGETFGMSTSMVENTLTRLTDAASAAEARGAPPMKLAIVSAEQAKALGLKDAHQPYIAAKLAEEAAETARLKAEAEKFSQQHKSLRLNDNENRS